MITAPWPPLLVHDPPYGPLKCTGPPARNSWTYRAARVSSGSRTRAGGRRVPAPDRASIRRAVGGYHLGLTAMPQPAADSYDRACSTGGAAAASPGAHHRPPRQIEVPPTVIAHPRVGGDDMYIMGPTKARHERVRSRRRDPPSPSSGTASAAKFKDIPGTIFRTAKARRQARTGGDGAARPTEQPSFACAA